MARLSVIFVTLAATSLTAAAMRSVPLGECYDCEVTCFEDCALKYDREIIQMDFLQVPEKKNRTEELTEQYGTCLKEDNCPCPKASKGLKALELVVAGKKKGKCVAGQASCSAKCGKKVVDADIAKLTKEAAPAKTALLQKKGFPLHPVKINAFAKGAMTLDHCLKYCLAATCGCEDAPGMEGNIKKLVEQNAAAGGYVTDTPASDLFKPAKIEECAKGMIGKKVASDLYIKLEGGPGGMYEVCSKDFLSKLLGPSGDIDGMTAKCKSGASDDSKFGCLWDAEKNVCVVGFSPILRCQVKYTNDPTF